LPERSPPRAVSSRLIRQGANVSDMARLMRKGLGKVKDGAAARQICID
jgi:glycerate-2-kinase